VDVVLLTLAEGRLWVGLQARDREPFKGRLALIGGYVHAEEDADTGATALRVLRQKTGLDGFFVEQLATFSGPARDPRGWSVSVAYFALTPHGRLRQALEAGARLELHPANAALGLPFDHDAIVQAARARLRGKGAYSTLPSRLLDETFTLSELQEVYRIALDQPRIDTSSFRRKLGELNLVEPVEGARAETGGRQAQLYRMRQDVTVFSRRL
jgi:8-oxo-dGTP diphosphatase